MKLSDFKRFIVCEDKKPLCKWKDPNNWLTYDEALTKAKSIKNGSISLVLGKIDDDFSIAGIDIDTVRNKDTGKINEMIEKKIINFKHKHLSQSKTGLHILCLIQNEYALEKGKNIKLEHIENDFTRVENGEEKKPAIEFYSQNKLFTIPLDTNVDEDNIVVQTDDFIKVFNAFTIKPNTDEWLNALLNGDRPILKSESENDYALMGELKKRGYTKENAIETFKNSNHFKSKNEEQKKKCIDRDDYLPNLYDNATSITNEKSVSMNKVNSVLALLEEYPKYNDEMNHQHIIIDNIDYDLSTDKFKRKLETLCFRNNLTVGKDLIIKTISILMTEIAEKEKTLKLDVRVVEDENNNFLYQLEKNKMVVINDKGFSISAIDNQPIFKVNNIFEEQVEPVNGGISSIDKILKLFNVKSEDDRLLLYIYIASLFIPNISKSFLILTAEKGAGKSMGMEMIKKLVDPSPVLKSPLPSVADLSSRLARSYLVCFDNIDSISIEQSNALCRACTGDANEKRALYTNDDAYIHSYIRPVIINGINCPAYREDLLDRCIILELKRIQKKDRLTKAEIDEILEKEKPYALASLFNIISKARVIKKTLKLTEKERLADWYEWAYSIAEAIEPNGGKRFKKIYQDNYNKRNTIVINNNPIALALREYISKWNKGGSIELTSSELHKNLLDIALFSNYKGFPNSPTWLTNGLNRIITTLEQEGIIVETGIEKSKANYIKITKNY